MEDNPSMQSTARIIHRCTRIWPCSAAAAAAQRGGGCSDRQLVYALPNCCRCCCYYSRRINQHTSSSSLPPSNWKSTAAAAATVSGRRRNVCCQQQLSVEIIRQPREIISNAVQMTHYNKPWTGTVDPTPLYFFLTNLQFNSDRPLKKKCINKIGQIFQIFFKVNWPERGNK